MLLAVAIFLVNFTSNFHASPSFLSRPLGMGVRRSSGSQPSFINPLITVGQKKAPQAEVPLLDLWKNPAGV